MQKIKSNIISIFCLQANFRVLRVVLFTFAILQLLLACGAQNDDGEKESLTPSRFAVPSQLKSGELLSSGQLRAFLVIDLETEVEMNINNGVAEVTLDELSVGPHSIFIFYEFEHPDFSEVVQLGEAFKNFAIEPGVNPDLSFSDDDFSFDLDTDLDGMTNLDEVIAGRNPLVFDGDPVATTVVVDLSELLSQMNFLSTGTLKALISFDGASSQEMSITDTTAQLDFDEITSGDIGFSLLINFDHQEFGENIRIAEVAGDIEIVAGRVEINLTEDDFDTDVDTDSDGETNLIELSNNSNPLVFDDNSPPEPEVALVFPPPLSLTSESTVLVRGTSIAVTELRVNGVTATMADDLSSWSAELPLAFGDNGVSLEFVDEAAGIQNQILDVARVTRVEQTSLKAPEAIALDSTGSRVLVTDPELQAIVEIDLSTGEHSIFSSNDTGQVSEASFSSPREIVVDNANGRALVFDSEEEEVVEVNLQTGVRSEFVEEVSNITAMEIDAATDRLLLIDDFVQELIGIDLSSGEDDYVADIRRSSLDISVDGGRALVLDQLPSIYSVDFSSNDIVTLSRDTLPNTENPFVSPVAMALDSSNNRALVVDGRAVLDVSLINGERSVFSDKSLPSQTNPFFRPTDIVVDSETSRALVLDAGLKSLVSVDLSTGSRELISNQHTPDSNDVLFTPGEISIDLGNRRAMLTDAARESIALIDLDTGRRTHFPLNNSLGEGDLAPLLPADIALQDDGNQVFVLDSSRNAVLTLDIASGEYAVFSAQESGVVLITVEDIALDDSLSRLLVSDSGLDAIVLIDKASGLRSVLSNNDSGDIIDNFVSPSEIVVDDQRNRLLVVDNDVRAIFSVDLENGTRRRLWNYFDENQVDLQISDIEDISIDTKNNRIILVDAVLKELMAIDLDSGERKVLFSSSSFETISGLAIDSDNDFAYISDLEEGAFIVVDLLTAEQVVVSQ